MPDILVDSSFLIALYDVRDAKHEEAYIAALLYDQDFVIPQVVLTEAVYFMKTQYRAEGAVLFLNKIIEEKKLLQDINYSDLILAKSIMAKYEFDFVDCCLMALAERLHITTIATLDQRDFYIYRPTHTSVFDLLP